MTVIAASKAKARFSELLNRAKRGESFAITLRGEEVARLVPAESRSLADVRAAIFEIKSDRLILNSKGRTKLRLKHLFDEGRP